MILYVLCHINNIQQSVVKYFESGKIFENINRHIIVFPRFFIDTQTHTDLETCDVVGDFHFHKKI